MMGITFLDFSQTVKDKTRFRKKKKNAITKYVVLNHSESHIDKKKGKKSQCPTTRTLDRSSSNGRRVHARGTRRRIHVRTKPDIARGRINDLSLGQDRDCTGGLKSSRDLVYGSNLTVGRRLFSATTTLSLQRLCKKFRLPGSTRGLLFSLFFLLFLTHSHVHYFSLSLSLALRVSKQTDRSASFRDTTLASPARAPCVL